MQRRLVLRFLVLLLVAGIFAACGPTPGPIEPVTPEVEVTEAVVTVEPFEVRLVGWTSTGPEDDLQRYLLDQCGVTYELVERVDYRSWLLTMFSAGEPFDILYMDTGDFHSFREKDVLAPVDDSAGIALDEFREPLVYAFTFDDTPYGVPRDFDTLALFYNRNLFAEAGLEEPNNDWTWGDLEKAAQYIIEATGVPGFSVPASGWVFSPFVLQAGGQIMAPDLSDTWIDSEEAIEAGWFYTGAREQGWAIIPEDVGASWQGEAFGWGSVAMVLGDQWMQSYLSGEFPDLEYGAVHPPAGPDGEGNLVYATAYAVSANSSAPQAAWQAIACLTSEEAQSLVLESGVALPSRPSLGEHPYFQDNPVANAIFTGVEFATPYAWGPHHGEVNRAITEALQRVYYEGWPVDESLRRAAKEIRAVIWE